MASLHEIAAMCAVNVPYTVLWLKLGFLKYYCCLEQMIGKSVKVENMSFHSIWT